MKKRMTRIVSLALALLMAAALCACSGTSGGKNDSGAPPPSSVTRIIPPTAQGLSRRARYMSVPP